MGGIQNTIAIPLYRVLPYPVINGIVNAQAHLLYVEAELSLADHSSASYKKNAFPKKKLYGLVNETILLVTVLHLSRAGFSVLGCLTPEMDLGSGGEQRTQLENYNCHLHCSNCFHIRKETMASSVLPPSSELLKQEILMLLRGILEAILALTHKMRYIQTVFGKVIKSLSKMIFLVFCI